MILALLAAAMPAAAADEAFETEASVHVLENGLTVIIEESHRTDTVALHLSYGVGALDEAGGTFGCAHLFEHLMFEGSANVGQNMFDTWLTEAGGNNNAFTSTDETAYYMSFPSGALDLALFLESDRMGFLDAGLTDENVTNQQSVVLQERATGYESPHGRDWDALQRIAYDEAHPYHHPVIGTVQDINDFQIDRVRSFWDAHYRPQNAVMALVGNFEAEEALARVEHWFSDVPDRGPAAERPSVPVDLERPVNNGYIEDDVEDATLYIAYPGAPLKHEDEPALDMLSYVLSNGRGTRLDDALYYDKPLTLDVGTYADASHIDGTFLIYASTNKWPLKKLDKKISKVLKSVEKDPITKAELDRAKTALRGSILDSLEDPLDRAEFLVDCYKYNENANCGVAEWERYEALTPGDVMRVFDTYLDPEKRSTLSVVPRGNPSLALKGASQVELP